MDEEMNPYPMKPATGATPPDQPSTDPAPATASGRTFKEAWARGSPHEVKNEAKRVVEKGVKAISGALAGFSQAMRDERIPDQAKEAVKKAGETTRKIAHATESEIRESREKVKRVAGEVKHTGQEIKGEWKKKKEGRAPGVDTAAGDEPEYVGGPPPY